MNEALLATLRAAISVYEADGQPDLAQALREAARIVRNAPEPEVTA